MLGVLSPVPPLALQCLDFVMFLIFDKIACLGNYPAGAKRILEFQANWEVGKNGSRGVRLETELGS